MWYGFVSEICIFLLFMQASLSIFFHQVPNRSRYCSVAFCIQRQARVISSFVAETPSEPCATGLKIALAAGKSDYNVDHPAER